MQIDADHTRVVLAVALSDSAMRITQHAGGLLHSKDAERHGVLVRWARDELAKAQKAINEYDATFMDAAQ